jgi:Fe-S-cluster containining protein
MSQHKVFQNYAQLLTKVDEFFRSIHARHSEKFSCARGCYGCCRQGLSVAKVEADFIKRWLQDHPDQRAKIKDISKMKNDPEFCRFLDAEGACSIYEARPIICRTHGAPVSWVEENASGGVNSESRDVCPLNFQGENLEELNGQDVLSLDKLNALLSVITRNYSQSNEVIRESLKSIAEDA